MIDLDTGLLQRTIELPVIVEGALTYVSDGVDPANDRLVVASNRAELLAEFLPADPDAVDPAVTDYAPLGPEEVHVVTRDGSDLDIEFTGLAYDPGSSTLWAVDALSGVLMQLAWSAGVKGDSESSLGHPYVSLTRDGEGVVPSALAFDGAELHLTVATDPTATSLFSIDPTALDVNAGQFEGAPWALPLVPDVPFLPEVARPIAAGESFLRFRLTLNGLHDDELHASGFPVAFRDLSVDEVELQLRNSGF